MVPTTRLLPLSALAARFHQGIFVTGPSGAVKGRLLAQSHRPARRKRLKQTLLGKAVELQPRQPSPSPFVRCEARLPKLPKAPKAQRQGCHAVAAVSLGKAQQASSKSKAHDAIHREARGGIGQELTALLPAAGHCQGRRVSDGMQLQSALHDYPRKGRAISKNPGAMRLPPCARGFATPSAKRPT